MIRKLATGVLALALKCTLCSSVEGRFTAVLTQLAKLAV